ncbi:MAG: heme exporter protein CcmB, partial [Acidobacteriota bacterium]|nr:heme exporter protein CcmB [Acidobacteriota bacterium]
MIGSFFRVAWHVMRKDLTVEVRSKEVLLTTLFFAVSVVLVFSFAIVREGRAPDDVAAGILWVAVSFSGTLAMARTFERERYNDTLRALLLAPSDRPAIYAGKLLGLLVLLALVEIVLVPLVGLLFNAPVLAYPGRLAALLALGTLGFAAVGTLFAAMLVRVRSRAA